MFTLHIIAFDWNEYSVDLLPWHMPHDMGEMKTYMICNCKNTNLLKTLA